MKPALAGVVIHPWMTRPPGDVTRLAASIRGKAEALDAALQHAATTLAGGPDPDAGPDQAAAIHPGAAELDGAARRFAADQERLIRALGQVADALDELAGHLAGHGPRIEQLTAALRAAQPLEVKRIGELRSQIRRRTDALSDADVHCRRRLEQALREIPGIDSLVSLIHAAGAGPAPARLPSSASALRDQLSQRPAGDIERLLAAQPHLHATLLGDVPGLGADPGTALASLAARAGARDRPGPAAPAPGGEADPVAARISQVRAGFARIGPDATTRLALLWPGLIGPLDGAPVSARAQANRAALRAALESARRTDAQLEARALARRIADEPHLLRRLRAAASRRYARADWLTSLVSVQVDEPLVTRTDLRTRIRLYLRLLTERTGPAGRPRTLLVFDARGRGRIVELMGEWGEATERVVVVVPGTGTGMPGYHMPAGTAADLVAADPSGRTAAVCWMGAEFPLAIINEAVLAGFARRAGPALTATLVALDVPAGVTVTVVGHSYGSPMVGAAEVAGLPADRVVHLASPGAGPGVRSLSDYAPADPRGRVRHVQRFACTAPGDPIRYVTSPVLEQLGRLLRLGSWLPGLAALTGRFGLGIDPFDLPGVTAFPAGVWEVPHGELAAGTPVSGPAGHAGVITSGTTAFRTLAAIVTAPAGAVRLGE